VVNRRYTVSPKIADLMIILFAAALGAVAAVTNRPWILPVGAVIMALYMWKVRFKRD
jgi:4-hydroxybenzoate polyprenyltransferase